MKLATLSLVLVVAVLLIFSFGPAMMHMDDHGICPVMGMSAICQMNPLEHLGKWQAMFTALPLEIILFAFALLFLLVNMTFVKLFARSPPPRPNSTQFNFFKSPLQEAFSDGLLNPKIY